MTTGTSSRQSWGAEPAALVGRAVEGGAPTRAVPRGPASPDTLVRRRVAHVMGMPVSLALRGRHADDLHGSATWHQTMAELRRLDRVFSTYRDDSFVSRLARGEADVRDCPAEVAEVLALGERARVESGGAFDVLRPGPDGGRILDPSGVVKGWAVERAAAPLRALSGTDFCLSAGGDMVCHVAGPDRPAWRVGVEDPLGPARIVARVEVRDGAVATSGPAHRGAHLVDARTGRVPPALAAVTVVAADLTWADIDATAAFALGAGAVGWLRTRPGRRGVVVHADGTAEVFGPPAVPTPGACSGQRHAVKPEPGVAVIAVGVPHPSYPVVSGAAGPPARARPRTRPGPRRATSGAPRAGRSVR